MLSLRLLGSPVFLVDGLPLAGLRYPQGRKLLAYLALQKGRPVERVYLAGTFWPETEEALALFYLRRVLSDLRKALGTEAARLGSPTARTLVLDLGGVECDLDSGQRGELLQGWTDDWVLTARQARQSATLAAPGASRPHFHGREALLSVILAQLPSARLVTLTGPGGVGKTRLARAVAQAWGERTGFVSLASLPQGTTHEELLHTVATALELSTSGLSEQRLAALLRSRFSLIVLDNCEQVLEPVVALVTALHEVRFLATSRIPLACPGEQLVFVPPLALEVATTLFLEHAAIQGNIYPCDATIEAICQSVDCLPLALELAASRLGLMTPMQLRERLSAPLRLLRRSQPTGPLRQATLEATIQWSYSLLPEPERLAFLRLGVFQGAWSLEAAEAVLETPDACLLLESLVRQSLVVVCQREPEPRFDFLETIREFVRTCPREPDSLQAAEAHAHYFSALAHQARPEQRLWITRLEEVRREFPAALSWFQHHDPATGIALMLALETLWTRLGNGFPSRGYLAMLLEAGKSALSTQQLIQGRRLLGMLTLDYPTAQALLTEAHTLATVHGLERVCANCLLALCQLEKQRDADAVRRYALEAQQCFQRLGDLEGEAHALEFEAVAALCQGKLAEAERGYTRFLVLARQQENHISTGDAHYGLAQVLFLQERYPEAQRVAQEAAEQMPDDMGQANTHYLLAELARLCGHTEAALTHYAAALRICDENLIRVLPAFIERSRAIVLAQQRDFAAAWASIQKAFVEFRRYRIEAQLGSTLAEMAWIAQQEGKPQEALTFLEQAAQAPPRDARHPRDEARLRSIR